MTDEQEKAAELAQQKLNEAHRLLDEAAKLADENRFDLSFLGAIYLPKDATYDEIQENDWPTEVNYDTPVPGEWWMPSTC